MNEVNDYLPLVSREEAHESEQMDSFNLYFINPSLHLKVPLSLITKKENQFASRMRNSIKCQFALN